jgi:hypothetical protein
LPASGYKLNQSLVYGVSPSYRHLGEATLPIM